MQTNPRVHFHGIPHSDLISDYIEKKIAQLEKFCADITSCEVVVELASHRHKNGNQYNVQVMVDVPRGRLVAGRNPVQDLAHRDAFVAARDAFAAMRRLLQEHMRVLRRETKIHAPTLAEGRVARLLGQEDYGFIATPDGTEVYFDRNAVLDGAFDRLEVGAVVRFATEMGEDGPQASTVYAMSVKRAPAPPDPTVAAL